MGTLSICESLSPRWKRCDQRQFKRPGMGARGDKPNAEEQEEVLTRMVQAEYLLDQPCRMCDGKEGFCFNLFCLRCQIGGLCASLFQSSSGPHFQHDKIQVFKTSYQYVVRETEMQAYFDITRLIQKYNSNGTKCYYLRTKQSSGSSASTSAQVQSTPSTSHSPRRSLCKGCLKMFTLPRDAMANPGLVCSVECLLRYNRSARLKRVNWRRRARKQKNPTRSPRA